MAGKEEPVDSGAVADDDDAEIYPVHPAVDNNVKLKQKQFSVAYLLDAVENGEKTKLSADWLNMAKHLSEHIELLSHHHDDKDQAELVRAVQHVVDHDNNNQDLFNSNMDEVREKAVVLLVLPESEWHQQQQQKQQQQVQSQTRTRKRRRRAPTARKPPPAAAAVASTTPVADSPSNKRRCRPRATNNVKTPPSYGEAPEDSSNNMISEPNPDSNNDDIPEPTHSMFAWIGEKVDIPEGYCRWFGLGSKYQDRPVAGGLKRVYDAHRNQTKKVVNAVSRNGYAHLQAANLIFSRVHGILQGGCDKDMLRLVVQDVKPTWSWKTVSVYINKLRRPGTETRAPPPPPVSDRRSSKSRPQVDRDPSKRRSLRTKQKLPPSCAETQPSSTASNSSIPKPTAEMLAWIDESADIPEGYCRWFGLGSKYKDRPVVGGLKRVYGAHCKLTKEVASMVSKSGVRRLQSANTIFNRVHEVLQGGCDKNMLQLVVRDMEPIWSWTTAGANVRKLQPPSRQELEVRNHYSVAVLYNMVKNGEQLPPGWEEAAGQLAEDIDGFNDVAQPLVLWAFEEVLEGQSLLDFDRRDLNLQIEDLLASVPDSRTSAQNRHWQYVKDPNSVAYVEETAFAYHDPAAPGEKPRMFFEETVEDSELKPLPCPPKLRSPPPNSEVVYTFDEQSRVYRVNCQRVDRLPDEDIAFIGYLFERSDIAVVSTGLLKNERDPRWLNDNLVNSHGEDWCHRVRQYTACSSENGQVEYQEQKRLITMRLRDFIKYAGLWEQFQNNEIKNEADYLFDVDTRNPLGGNENVQLDVRKDIIYVIDHDLTTGLARHDTDFHRSFRLPQVLPGGEWCMLRPLPDQSRQFMGPNMYLTLPGAFTQMHQDGRGTVDSGHMVLSGYNDVIKLRRIPQRHKILVNSMLVRDQSEKVPYDGVNGIPHAEDQGSQPKWFTASDVKKWKNMGYEPQVLVLKPGEHIHLNKGCLHAFRKAHPTAILAEGDCHKHLRCEIPSGLKPSSYMCTSVAWDWIYQGFTAAGVNSENVAALSGALVNKRNGFDSLGQTQLCVLKKAQEYSRSTVAPFSEAQRSREERRFEVCKGLLPCLSYIVKSQIAEMERAEAGCKGAYKIRNERFLGVATKVLFPDIAARPDSRPINPYGNEGFNCTHCFIELPNYYFHCEGCEKILEKDFNLCENCFSKSKFAVEYDPKSRCPGDYIFSDLCHTGRSTQHRATVCPTVGGASQCLFCQLCTHCSCTCHNAFQYRRRFYEPKQLQSILRNCEEFVGTGQLEKTRETAFQLRAMGGPYKDALAAKLEVLKLNQNRFGGEVSIDTSCVKTESLGSALATKDRGESGAVGACPSLAPTATTTSNGNHNAKTMSLTKDGRSETSRPNNDLHELHVMIVEDIMENIRSAHEDEDSSGGSPSLFQITSNKSTSYSLETSCNKSETHGSAFAAKDQAEAGTAGVCHLTTATATTSGVSNENGKIFYSGERAKPDDLRHVPPNTATPRENGDGLASGTIVPTVQNTNRRCSL